jgi:hypothetical protein
MHVVDRQRARALAELALYGHDPILFFESILFEQFSCTMLVRDRWDSKMTGAHVHWRSHGSDSSCSCIDINIHIHMHSLTQRYLLNEVMHCRNTSKVRVTSAADTW